MTPKGTELIRELRDALNAGDIESASRLLDPEVVQYGTRGGIDQDRVFRGRQEVLDYWNEVGDTWGSLRLEPERIIESGDLVVVLRRETARIARTDLEVQSETGSVFKIREGKILEMRGYMDRDEAMRAAGVAE